MLMTDQTRGKRDVLEKHPLLGRCFEKFQKLYVICLIYHIG